MFELRDDHACLFFDCGIDWPACVEEVADAWVCVGNEAFEVAPELAVVVEHFFVVFVAEPSEFEFVSARERVVAGDGECDDFLFLFEWNVEKLEECGDGCVDLRGACGEGDVRVVVLCEFFADLFEWYVEHTCTFFVKWGLFSYFKIAITRDNFYSVKNV